jgi:hypothetical protein
VETSVLDIRLFGELELRMGRRSLPRLESERAESLLAYLLLHREAAQPRQRLAFLLWPDSTESQARTNLRDVLHNLRLTMFTAESLGGPDRFTRELGFQHLSDVHRGLRITDHLERHVLVRDAAPGSPPTVRTRTSAAASRA